VIVLVHECLPIQPLTAEVTRCQEIVLGWMTGNPEVNDCSAVRKVLQTGQTVSKRLAQGAAPAA
jgi:hypothetical protein